MTKRAIIIGAGPAGLTAAYELLKRTDISPVILEKSGEIGGISKTIQYKGNRMDMGPHRFFSKSDRVMDWWLHIMPLENNEGTQAIHYQHKVRKVEPSRSTDQPHADKTMLIIRRLTRIYFLRKFFAYPIQLSLDTLKTLGFWRTIKIIFSYAWVKLIPRKPEKSLEDFIINKFGQQLYLLFFKDYTEKVWGVPCRDISAEWGSQRIKGVSLSKAIAQAVRSLNKGKDCDLGKKTTETSLIEQFLYPKYGPGSLWEEVARQVQEMGGSVHLNQDVQKITFDGKSITSITSIDSITGQTCTWEGDYFFSTMPVQELIANMGSQVPEEVQGVATGLQYRDFINVGVLLRQFSVPTKKPDEYNKIELKDNWIYVQERDVKVGRLMIYNNWGGGMVKDPDTTWIGMEYFCNKSDDFWVLDDLAIQQLAIQELEKMQLIRSSDVIDTTVHRMEKTYPAYLGSYGDFAKIRGYTDQFTNLFLVGRNGMHKYNNTDHSMLTAMVAVDNIAAGILSKGNIWAINTEQEYHEEKKIVEAVDQSLQPRKTTPGLAAYVWNYPWHRAYCFLALGVWIIQFLFFKLRYPFANYMPDSYSYLEAAANNADVNMWPVAYSKFLRLISVFTHSDKILVGMQYFFMQIAAVIFLFSLLHFLNPAKWIKNAFFIFFLLNPVPLFIANYISADALFIGLSLLWVTTLIFIIYRPHHWQLVAHAILLLACFTLRYNAIYYPMISGIAFMLARRPWAWRIGGFTLGVLLVFLSIRYTSTKMLEVSGKQQFSAFGGWQLANNALYMYEHVPASQRKPVPSKFLKLETMVRQHIDTLKKVKLSHEDSASTFFYLWSGRGPLVQYVEREFKKDSTTPYFKRWAIQGPLYQDYATFLIWTYPWHYIEDFMIPNAIKWAIPPTEFLATYNMGSDSVRRLARDWFQYKSLRVAAHKEKAGIIWLTEWYPMFTALVNLLLLINLIGLLLFGSLKGRQSLLPKLLILVFALWLLNAGFSIVASPVVLRYQVFPILVTFCMALLAAEPIYQQKKTQSEQI